MNETLPLILSALAGVLLGAIFFGGLWWTVRRGAVSPRPAWWFLGSALLRMSIALAGFYLVADSRWQRLLACLIGFILARLLVTRLTRPPANTTGLTTASKRASSLFHPPANHAKNNMMIQINTDHTIHGSDQLTAEIEATVHSSLSRHQDRLSRVEVHLSDENAGKGGGNDIRCVMEARPAGLQPVAVTHHAGELTDAVAGAAQKLKAAVDHTFGKLRPHQT